jgi:hypothetical protein
LAEGRSTNNQENMVTLAKVPNNCTHGQIKARHLGEGEAVRKPELEWTNVWPVAIRTLGENPLVEDHRISLDQDGLFVTHVTGNFGVPALKRKMCPRVVIEG